MSDAGKFLAGLLIRKFTARCEETALGTVSRRGCSSRNAEAAETDKGLELGRAAVSFLEEHETPAQFVKPRKLALEAFGG